MKYTQASGLKGADFSRSLADIKEEKTPGQRSIDFSGDKDKKLLDLVSAAWGDAQERWLIFQRQIGKTF